MSRLSDDFAEFIDEDEVLVLDIMKLQGKLTRSELSRKIVIVAKKQSRNLERLIEFIQAQAAFQNRKILIVDDEADLAGVRFVAKRAEGIIDQGKIANQIDALRNISQSVSFLQVTATPYSLYLQPEGTKKPTPARTTSSNRNGPLSLSCYRSIVGMLVA